MGQHITRLDRGSDKERIACESIKGGYMTEAKLVRASHVTKRATRKVNWTKGRASESSKDSNGAKMEKVEQVGNGLLKYPEDLIKCTTVESVDLSCNLLTQVPELQCPRLSGLLLFGNKLSQLEKGITVPHLWVLDLGSNLLSEFPNLSSCLHLITIDLSSNQITTINDAAVASVKSVKTLKLQYNQLRFLPDSIGWLLKLQRFYVHCNQLTSLPSTISNMIALQELNVSENHLTSVPDDLCVNMPNLKTLDLSFNKITTCPSSIWQCSSLKILSIQNNLITDLNLPSEPRELLAPCGIEIVNASNNKLELFPDNLPMILFRAATVNLSHNNIHSLPTTLAGFTSLTRFNMSYNQLTTLPESLQDIRDLRELELQFNKLGPGLITGTNQSAYELLGSCQLLVVLNLGYNGLMRVPDSLGEMGFLNRLFLGGNLLEDVTFFPQSLISETNLHPVSVIPRTLDLSCNQLRTIPSALMELMGVEHLFLHGNPFTSPPPADMLSRLPSLKRLTLSEPIQPEPLKEFLQSMDNHPALQYLFMPSSRGPSYLLECNSLQAKPSSDGGRWTNRYKPVLDGPMIHCRIGHTQTTGVKAKHFIEDMINAIPMPNVNISEGGTDYLAVFDGHGGGAEASTFMMENMHEILLDTAANYHSKLSTECLIEAFEVANEKLRVQIRNLDHMPGTTAVMVLVTSSELLCSNIGDSRAVVAVEEVDQDGQIRLEAIALSHDQKPGVPDERERIRAAGGYVTESKSNMASSACRLSAPKKKGGYHSLGVARSVGDYQAGPGMS
eukprot:Ihof_evm2s306 gene=Ihof_evmTU2s306